MSNTEKIGRKAIKITNIVVNSFVLIAILLLLAFGSYAIWDSNQVFSAADSANYAIFRPSDEDEASFQELQAINSDVFAWLTVFGTNIDYPVVQGEHNMFYVSRDARGNHSLAGSIFLDSDACNNFTDFSAVLYGHHMARGAMFGDIEYFAVRDYFDARRYGMLYFNGREHGLEFFSFVHTDAHNGEVFRSRITEQDEQQAYLDMLLQMAIHTHNDVPVTIDDRIVLLSTCSEASTNGRDILIGRITNEVFDDPFWTENPDRTNILPMIDRLPDVWAQAPIWARIGIITLPCLLALALVVFLYKKHSKRKGRI